MTYFRPVFLFSPFFRSHRSLPLLPFLSFQYYNTTTRTQPIFTSRDRYSASVNFPLYYILLLYPLLAPSSFPSIQFSHSLAFLCCSLITCEYTTCRLPCMAYFLPVFLLFSPSHIVLCLPFPFFRFSITHACTVDNPTRTQPVFLSRGIYSLLTLSRIPISLRSPSTCSLQYISLTA